METINRQIILLGNGPSVIDSECGKEIDQFDTVVRFNNFVIDGYEKFVGTKTDVWARNNSFGVKAREVQSFRQILIVSPEWNFKNIPQLQKIYDSRFCFVIPREYSLDIQNILKLPGKMGDRKQRRAWPTTGIITLYYYLRFYPMVYVHGFDHFAGQNHYFDKEKMLPFIQMAKQSEKKWIEEKIQEGSVRRLV